MSRSQQVTDVPKPLPRNAPLVRYRRIAEAIEGSVLFTVNRGLSAAYAPGIGTDALDWSRGLRFYTDDSAYPHMSDPDGDGVVCE